MNCQRIGSLPREFDALDRNKILSLLVQCIAKLPKKPKKVLVLYYHENLPLADIATGLGMTEYDTDQMRTKTLRVLQMMLTTQLSAAELPLKGSAKKGDRSEGVKGKITLPAGKAIFSDSGNQMYRGTIKMPQSVLAILTVMDRPVGGKGSLVEVVLCHPQKDASPNIQTEYDLASLGEIESIHGPYCDPPRWMVSYKGKVSEGKGEWIMAKE